MSSATRPQSPPTAPLEAATTGLPARESRRSLTLFLRPRLQIAPGPQSLTVVVNARPPENR